MKVRVKQKNIEEGQASCGLSCAIALAVRDTFKTNNVYVTFNTEDDKKDNVLQIEVGSNKNKKIFNPVYKQQCQVEEFISDFDCGNEVEPFEFEIEEVK